MHLKGEECSGGKNSKIRLTGLAAANMCGEKIPIFVIGKSNKLRCFKWIKSTPCRYRAQNKNWMDSKLFEKWVREQDRKFVLEGRKVVLVIDNCTAHPNIENLKSITLLSYPKYNLFVAYGSRTHSIVEVQVPHSNNQDDHKCYRQWKTMPSISILEAMKVQAHSWSEVSESTIINCFRKAGFKEGVSDEDDDPFSAFKSSIDQLRQRDENVIPNDFTYKDIVTVDDDIAVMGSVMTDEEIGQDLIELAEEEVQGEDEEVTDETITKPTTEEIRLGH